MYRHCRITPSSPFNKIIDYQSKKISSLLWTPNARSLVNNGRRQSSAASTNTKRVYNNALSFGRHASIMGVNSNISSFYYPLKNNNQGQAFTPIFLNIRNFSSTSNDPTNSSIQELAPVNDASELNLEEMLTMTSDTLTTAAPELHWYFPSHWVVSIIQNLQESTGYPYCISMVLATVFLRTALFPLAVLIRDNNSRRDAMAPEMKKIIKEFERDEAQGVKRSDARKRQLQKHINALYDKYGYVPKYQFLFPILNISCIITIIMGLQDMRIFFPTEMSTGGALWFIDLTQPDPIKFLPILSWTSFFLMSEMGADGLGRPTKEMGRGMKVLTNSIRAVFLALMLNLPCCIFCYWIPNNMIAIGQTVMLANPKVLERLGIRQSPVEAIQSDTFILDEAKEKWDEWRGKKKKVKPIIQSDDLSSSKEGKGMDGVVKVENKEAMEKPVQLNLRQKTTKSTSKKKKRRR